MRCRRNSYMQHILCEFSEFCPKITGVSFALLLLLLSFPSSPLQQRLIVMSLKTSICSLPNADSYTRAEPLYIEYVLYRNARGLRKISGSLLVVPHFWSWAISTYPPPAICTTPSTPRRHAMRNRLRGAHKFALSSNDMNLMFSM